MYILFWDNETETQFVVEAENIDEAWLAVAENFTIDEVEMISVHPELPPDLIGLDIY